MVLMVCVEGRRSKLSESNTAEGAVVERVPLEDQRLSRGFKVRLGYGKDVMLAIEAMCWTESLSLACDAVTRGNGWSEGTQQNTARSRDNHLGLHFSPSSGAIMMLSETFVRLQRLVLGHGRGANPG